MPNYRRAKINGGTFFFTVILADRSSNLLIEEIDRLRQAYRVVQEPRPFETIAICVLPDHIHAVWASRFRYALESHQGQLLPRHRGTAAISKSNFKA
jgi:REP element-mobilizing transposase RayT